MKKVIRDVSAERDRQDEMWGEQNHDPYKYLAILVEEIGEVSDAILEADFRSGSWDNYRTELVQVAAVAVAMVECFDRSRSKGGL